METKTAELPRLPARERLLAAAAELFYTEGLNSVGIDKVIERAGVAKASLYSNFKSKDDLIRAYLAQRHAARKVRTQEWLTRYSKPRDKLLGMFDLLAELTSEPNYRGCIFQRANTELQAGNEARSVCETARQWLRGLFTELAKDAGATKPEQLARQLAMLYDGAVVSAQMDGELRAASVARGIAAQLLDAAIKK